MATLRMRARMEPDGPTHWAAVVVSVPGQFSGGVTDCGEVPLVLFVMADDAPVTCAPCLAAAGGPAVEVAERLLADVGEAVPA